MDFTRIYGLLALIVALAVVACAAPTPTPTATPEPPTPTPSPMATPTPTPWPSFDPMTWRVGEQDGLPTPDFQLAAAQGGLVSLSETLAENDFAVIVFYRGFF